MRYIGEVTSTKRTVQHDFYVYVDVVVMTVRGGQLHVLAIQRKNASGGARALPGGLVEPSEDLAEAASRELREETGIRVPSSNLVQIGAYGHPTRDTRYGRAITVAYLAMLPDPNLPRAGSDAKQAEFITYRNARSPRALEFDHRVIVRDARRLASRQLETTPIALEFCRREFTITELRHVYEAFYQRTLDAANFRRKVLDVEDFVIPLDFVETHSDSPGRPARLYRRGRAQSLYPPIHFRRLDDEDHARD